tara:strand:- start:345 stop:623 length:279 start_codon:yes stop_codon:yes gene_type:complete
VTGKRSTAKSIIIDYISSMFLQNIYKISSHDFEINVVKFGKDWHGKWYNPSTYSRAWRKLKETGRIPELDVFSIDTVKNKSAETTWVLRTRK